MRNGESQGARGQGAKVLLRLYPRAWRARYGDEVVAMLGDAPLTVQQTIDLALGAIDARLAAPPTRGDAMSSHNSTMSILKRACVAPHPQQGIRDGLIGAAVMIGASLAIVTAGIVLKRQGFPAVGESLTNIGFPIALLLWSDYTYLRRHSWRVRALITGTTLAILLASTVLSFRL